MAYSLSRADFISPEKLDHILKGFTDVTAVADIIAKVNGYPINQTPQFLPVLSLILPVHQGRQTFGSFEWALGG
jgi:hypothetical protein